jgi:hypothetical protein
MNDRRRDIYKKHKFVMDVSEFPSVSPWITISIYGGVMVNEIYDFGMIRTYGLFLTDW